MLSREIINALVFQLVLVRFQFERGLFRGIEIKHLKGVTVVVQNKSVSNGMAQLSVIVKIH